MLLSTSSTPDTQPTRLRWLVCALLFLATTINYIDRSVISLIEPVLHTIPFMGWVATASAAAQPVFNNNFGNILIYFQIAYGIGFLTAGRLIDRLGTRTGYALAILLWSLAAMAHALVGSVAGFCAARFLLGLGEAGNFPAAIKAITEWFPVEQRALATGIFNSGTNAASLLAPWLLPLITLRFGWHAAFLSTGALGLLWLLLWLAFPYNRLRPHPTTLEPAPSPQPGAPSMTQLHRDMGGINHPPSATIPGAPSSAFSAEGGVSSEARPSSLPQTPGAPSMTQLHRDMGGINHPPSATTPGAPSSALSAERGVSSEARPSSLPQTLGAPSMTQLHRDMGCVMDGAPGVCGREDGRASLDTPPSAENAEDGAPGMVADGG